MKTLLILLLVFAVANSFHFLPKEKKINGPPANNYPIRAVYIDRSDYWYGDKIAEALAVPGIAPPH